LIFAKYITRRRRNIKMGFLLSVIITVSVGVGNSSITGRVLDETTRAPLVGATVLLTGTSCGAMTDEFGYYLITGLPEGTYSVQARMVGKGEQTFEDVLLSPGETTQQDFYLIPQSPGFWLPEIMILI